MTESPPSPDNDQRGIGRLVIAHRIYAALKALAMASSISMILIYHKLNERGELETDGKSVFKTIYLPLIYFTGYFGAGPVLNLISAHCIRHRKYQIYSMIVSGFNRLCDPFGVALGIYSLIVPDKDTVISKYKAAA